jgi:hypothetical protein
MEEPVSNATDTGEVTDFTVDINSADMGVIDAVTPKGVRLVLVADPDEGDYLVIERIAFFGADSEWLAYKLGPGDKPRPEFTRFTALASDAAD